VRHGLQGALAVASIVLVGAGTLAAVRLTGGTPEPGALAAGWALAAVNAVGSWALNRWAMAGSAKHFVRRASVGLAVRVPLLAAGLLASWLLTHLQARSLLAAFFGAYFLAIVWEIASLHRMAKRA